jgi:gluconolactonase
MKGCCAGVSMSGLRGVSIMPELYRVIADGLAFPEGPVVMPDGSLIVVELAAGTVRRLWGDGRSELIACPGGGPNGAQLGPDGALYLCNNGGSDWARRRSLDGPDAVGRIERVDLASGGVERLYDACDGRPLRAPNDLVFDAEGGLWFTDMGKTLADAIETSAVLYARPDGSRIDAAFRGGIGYNGIGLSPDGTMLYVAETLGGRLWRFAIRSPGVLDAEDGVVTPRWMATAIGDARFDSLSVTVSGAICIGTVRTGGITRVSPEGKLTFFLLPDAAVTNIAFGSEDLQTAYICLGASGQVIAMRWDEPGLPLHFGYAATGTISSTTSSTRPSGS